MVSRSRKVSRRIGGSGIPRVPPAVQRVINQQLGGKRSCYRGGASGTSRSKSRAKSRSKSRAKSRSRSLSRSRSKSKIPVSQSPKTLIKKAVKFIFESPIIRTLLVSTFGFAVANKIYYNQQFMNYLSAYLMREVAADFEAGNYMIGFSRAFEIANTFERWRSIVSVVAGLIATKLAHAVSTIGRQS